MNTGALWFGGGGAGAVLATCRRQVYQHGDYFDHFDLKHM